VSICLVFCVFKSIILLLRCMLGMLVMLIIIMFMYIVFVMV